MMQITRIVLTVIPVTLSILVFAGAIAVIIHVMRAMYQDEKEAKRSRNAKQEEPEFILEPQKSKKKQKILCPSCGKLNKGGDTCRYCGCFLPRENRPETAKPNVERED